MQTTGETSLAASSSAFSECVGQHPRNAANACRTCSIHCQSSLRYFTIIKDCTQFTIVK